MYRKVFAPVFSLFATILLFAVFLPFQVSCKGGGGSSSPPVPPVPEYTILLDVREGIAPLSKTKYVVPQGSSFSFTPSTLSGYRDIIATSDKVSVVRSSGGTFTVGPVTSDATVVLMCTKIPISYTVTATALSGGTITPVLSSVVEGDSLLLKVVPNPGFAIDKVTNAEPAKNVLRVDGGDVVLANVHANDQVLAMFVPIVPPGNTYVVDKILATPQVLTDSEYTTTPVLIEVKMNTGTTTSYVQYNGVSGLSKFLLHDDGVNGDKDAGDGWFSALVTFTSVPKLLYYNQSVGETVLSVVGYTSSGVAVWPKGAINNRISIAAIDHRIAAPVVHQPDGTYTTKNTMTIVDPSVLSTTHSDLGTIVAFNAQHGDLFDFAYLNRIGYVSTDRTNASEVVRNDVEGIGLSLFDHTREFGSKGALRAVITPNEDLLGSLFLRSVGATWACYFDKPELKLSDAANHLIAGPSSHAGQMGNGYQLLDLSNGSFQVVQNVAGGYSQGNLYSDFERFLFGLIPPDAVAQLRFVKKEYTGSTSLGAIIRAEDTFLVGPTELAAVYGVRKPSSLASQKQFSLGWITVSPRTLTPAEFALNEWIAAYYTGNSLGGEVLYPSDGRQKAQPSFAAATKFTATLKCIVPY